MVSKTQNIVETLDVPAGYYDTIGKLLDVVNGLAGDMSITFLKYAKKIKIQNEGQYAIMFNASLRRILGLEDMVHYPAKTYGAKYNVDLLVKTTETLFIYYNVLEHVVAGDVMAPLLPIVDMKRGTEHGRMHKILNPPLYVPLQKKNFRHYRNNHHD